MPSTYFNYPANVRKKPFSSFIKFGDFWNRFFIINKDAGPPRWGSLRLPILKKTNGSSLRCASMVVPKARSTLGSIAWKRTALSSFCLDKSSEVASLFGLKQFWFWGHWTAFFLWAQKYIKNGGNSKTASIFLRYWTKNPIISPRSSVFWLTFSR